MPWPSISDLRLCVSLRDFREAVRPRPGSASLLWRALPATGPAGRACLSCEDALSLCLAATPVVPGHGHSAALPMTWAVVDMPKSLSEDRPRFIRPKCRKATIRRFGRSDQSGAADFSQRQKIWGDRTRAWNSKRMRTKGQW